MGRSERKRIGGRIVILVVLAGLLVVGIYLGTRPRVVLENFTDGDPMTFEINLPGANSVGSIRFEDSTGTLYWHVDLFEFSGGMLRYGDIATELPCFRQPSGFVPSQLYPEGDRPPQPLPPSSAIIATLRVQYDAWISACGGTWKFELRTDAHGRVTKVSRL